LAREEGLSGLLGGEDGAEPAETMPASEVDPAAMALAMPLAAADGSLAARATAYFDQQTRYVRTLLEHLHEQRAVQISLLELRRVSERLRLVTQSLIVVTALLVVFYLAVLLSDALSSRALIVQQIPAPPSFVARGVTPTVLGNAVLDGFSRLRDAARSNMSGHTLVSGWANEIQLEVPETGISVGEISRLLRERLGHDTRVGGDLVANADGTVTLTIRGDGFAARSFTGPADDWPKLITQATEYAYGEVEPALYAMYLSRSRRYQQAIDFSRTAVLSAPARDLPYLYNAWAVALSSVGAPLTQQLALEQRALALKPHYWTALGNAMLDARQMGEEEQAWRMGRALPPRGSGAASSIPPSAYTTWDILVDDLADIRASLLADEQSHGGYGSSEIEDDASIAETDADLHDPGDAGLRLLSLDPKDPTTMASAAYVHGMLAEQDGRPDAAARAMEAYGALMASPDLSQGDQSYQCDVAHAEILAGNLARAAAALTAGGRFVDCYRYHADLLDAQGDWPAAQAAYAAAVALAPDLPAAYYSWGLALARHNDRRGAIRKLQAAIRRGPNWAEPQAALGRLYAAEQRWFDAVRADDAALADAPAWQEVRDARDAARGHY
jgi:tetratricopeptide (TPR) repeat protein